MRNAKASDTNIWHILPTKLEISRHTINMHSETHTSFPVLPYHAAHFCYDVLIHGRDGLRKRPRRVRSLKGEGSAHDEQGDRYALLGAAYRGKNNTQVGYGQGCRV